MNIWKTLLIAFVVLTLGVAAFAWTRSGNLADPETQSYETVIGEFKSLGGIRVNRSITHLLEDENGEIYYTFSDRYDLSDARYMTGLWEVYGLLMHYPDLEKDVLEVRRLSAATPHEETIEAVAMLHFESPSWGLEFDYPSNWTLTEGTASILVTSTQENGSSIQIQKTPQSLTQGPDQEASVRVDELKNYAASQTALSGLESSENFLGLDRLLSLKLENPNNLASVTYLVPRFPELLRFDFIPGTAEPSIVLSESNVFAKMLASFRFSPVVSGATTADSSTTPIPSMPASSESSSSVTSPSAPSSTSVVTPSVTQKEFSKFTTLESATYGFKMSYPSPWYFQGDSGRYSFADHDLQINADGIILTMQINSSLPVGQNLQGAMFTLTVEKEGRKYTFEGPAEFQKVMQTMADSIVKL